MSQETVAMLFPLILIVIALGLLLWQRKPWQAMFAKPKLVSEVTITADERVATALRLDLEDIKAAEQYLEEARDRILRRNQELKEAATAVFASRPK
jgi:hypothetical protein